ncbi:MAG: alpha/beta hydrolase [Bacteroidetes bacterium]|nr:alpha/beta hydrolase [Fibrella sp.]
MNFAKLVFLFLALGLVSCSIDELQTEGNYFFLRSVGADMPVWVRGNDQSDVFVLFLHGGPGGTTHEYVKTPAFSRLEQRYRVVYWDQRASGIAQGNPNPESNTLAQFVADLDKVVNLLRTKYNNPKIFLMGHSWGGALGSAYLLDPLRQAKIRGWIDVDGAHNVPLTATLSRQFVIDYGDRAVVEGRDVPYWQETLARLRSNVPISTADFQSALDRANGNIYRPQIDGAQKPYVRFVFFSPFTLAATRMSPSLDLLFNEISGLDLSPQMGAIRLPALILWGQHDGNVPLPVGQEAYQVLGTPPGDKTLHIFEQSAHSPMDEEPIGFATQVGRFIDRYH